MQTSVVAPIGDGAAGESVIRLRGVEKVYRTGRDDYLALRGVDLDVASGELIAVVGPSGSGKSTILNIITGIDRPSAGEVMVTGRDLVELDEEALAVWRGEHVGIVFQFFQLLPTLTALENVMLPLDFARIGTVIERSERAGRRLEQVGLGDKLDNFPAELSGGEQQRVAIARAVAKKPDILLCDEPTGALDLQTGRMVLRALVELNHTLGMTILIITHNVAIAGIAHRLIRLGSGTIAEDLVVPDRIEPEQVTW